MKKILIFGDSYADPNLKAIGIYQQDTPWYELLGSDYKITNNALSGTGPHYSFKEYYNFILKLKNYEYEDYIVIFFLSGEDRIHFPKTNPEKISHINWDFYKKESWFCEHPDFVEEQSYYNTFKSEIDFFFLTMHEELKWSNFKNVGFLHMNSLILNMKTIVFCTFGNKILSNGEVDMDMTKLNNSNFYIHPIEMGYISSEEFKDRNEDNYDFMDHRRNHLSQQNHKVLYENIKKIIVNDYKNLIPFVKDIDESKNLGKRKNTEKTGDFIYE